MPFSFDGFPTLNETDLIYGLADSRLYYRRLEPFRIFGPRNNIDSYHISNKEISLVKNPENISYKNRSFIQYIYNHEKYSSIQSAVSMKGPLGWLYDDPSLVLGRKCKAGLGWASENDIHVNFILDDINMKEVVTKVKKYRYDVGGPKATSITSRELRYLYRNRNDEAIRRNVQFWNKGEPVEPPWETDSGTWSLYKPKSEFANPRAPTKAALEIRPAATGPAAATSSDEFLIIEEMSPEVFV